MKDVKVPRAGLEPARPNGHMALNHACLPIPAPGPAIVCAIFPKLSKGRKSSKEFLVQENRNLKM